MEEARGDDDRTRVATIQEALSVLERQPRGDDRTLRMVATTPCPTSSEKVVRIILSYTDYVNRVVWRKA